MPRADDAGYESTDDRSRCLEKTRVKLLDTLQKWTDDAGAPPVYWLSGHAGSGKTTIAQTYAEVLAKIFRLGASFFCSRDSQQRSNLKMIFVTLAFQLARGRDAASLVYRPALLRALKKYPDIGSLSLHNQLEHLIIIPAIESGLATVVIIDALDECRDKKLISTILDLLASNLGRIPHIKFFITSRPEPNIRKAFRLPQLKPVTKVLELHELQEVHADIRVYFETSLTKLAACSSHPDLAEGWPANEDLDLLTEKSGGLFIHASTVVKIISISKVHPQVKLRQLVENVGDYKREGAGKTGLDALYMGILCAALRKDEDEDEEDAKHAENTLRSILGFLVIARDTVSVASLADILGMKESSVLSSLASLHSLVLVPGDRARPIRFHHKSFPDFLTDPSRCTDPRFQISRDDHEFAAARNCLTVMKRKLKRNMCGLKRYAMNNSLNTSVRDKCIDGSLRYSCLYWINHMLSDSRSRDHVEGIRESLDHWLVSRLLQWLEVLSLLHELGQAVLALTAMRDWFISVRDPLSFVHPLLTVVAHVVRRAVPYVA